MHTIKDNFYNRVRKRIVFSFLLFFFFIFTAAQKFVRFSDGKLFDSLVVLQEGRKEIINNSNFKKFIFADDAKIYYQNQLVDFSLNNDALVFFDKVQEIEEVQIVGKKKSFKISRNKNRTKATADLFAGNLTATFIKLNTKNETYIKSIVLFPERISVPNGILKIQIVPNVNNFPKQDLPILSFEKPLSHATLKEWEITLPQIIKYPENGFFLLFYLEGGEKRNNISLRLNKDSQMYMYYPQSNEWKEMSFNSYQFKVKIFR